MNKEQKEQLQKDIDSIKEKLESMENQLKECDKEKLHLEVDVHGNLFINYKSLPLGVINVNGKCNILNNTSQIEVYEQWIGDGMPIYTESIVEWRGGEYKLSEGCGLYRMGSEVTNDANCTWDNYIYDFKSCYYYSDCNDPNIIRHKHNNRPVGF